MQLIDVVSSVVQLATSDEHDLFFKLAGGYVSPVMGRIAFALCCILGPLAAVMAVTAYGTTLLIARLHTASVHQFASFLDLEHQHLVEQLVEQQKRGGTKTQCGGSCAAPSKSTEDVHTPSNPADDSKTNADAADPRDVDKGLPRNSPLSLTRIVGYHRVLSSLTRQSSDHYQTLVSVSMALLLLLHLTVLLHVTTAYETHADIGQHATRLVTLLTAFFSGAFMWGCALVILGQVSSAFQDLSVLVMHFHAVPAAQRLHTAQFLRVPVGWTMHGIVFTPALATKAIYVVLTVAAYVLQRLLARGN